MRVGAYPGAVDPKTLEITLIIAFLVLSLGIHEAAHAWVASLCGDDTAKDEGRLTLNPIPHIDPIMTILLPAILALTTPFIFGGAKPVPVDPRRLRKPHRDMMLVALAGPVSNLILSGIFLVALKFLVLVIEMPADTLAPRVMYGSVFANLLLAAFNMLPIPPLDGSRVLMYLLPRDLKAPYASLERFGMLFVMLIIVSGGLSRILPIKTLYQWMWVITGGNWG